MASASLSSAPTPGYTPLVPSDTEKTTALKEPAEGRDAEVCMVFKYKTSKSVKYEERGDELAQRTLQEPTPDAAYKMQMWKQRRESILKSLQNCGLDVFCYYSRDRDEIFCKIGAGAEKLRDTAARMKYKLQLKPEYLSAYAEYRNDFPGRPEHHFADRRVVSHLYKTHTEDDLGYPSEDAIFTTIDKIYLINHIITSKDKDCAGINVGSLLHKDELKSYFPLHEDRKLRDLAESKWDWVWMSTDHANRVREYFGDKVALYYVFMAFYCRWLVIPAVVGLVLQIIGLFAGSPDNFTAILFCLLISVWTLLLPHFWRRQEAKYAISWGTLDLVPSLEPCRPEHWGDPRINPVTAQVEPFFPFRKRLWKYIFSATVISFSGVVLVGVVLMLLFYSHKYKGNVPGGVLTFQFLFAVFVEIVNAVLTRLSKWLTNRENHRTQSEYEMHLLAKVFGFKILNSYFILYYIAFLKSHLVLFGEEQHCLEGADGRDDCFLDLEGQLAVFVLTRLTLMNLVEYLQPKLAYCVRHCVSDGQTLVHNLGRPNLRIEMADMSSAEKQSKKEPYSAFNDFDETLITHGYGTLFVVTSPWICSAVLIWTVCEIVLDMKGLTQNRQRCLPVAARNNEPWNTAFEVYGVIGAFTNVVLLVFASKQYESWSDTQRLTLFLYLGHMLILSRIAVHFLFPEIPSSVKMLQKKHDNMVHRCLENIKVEQQHDFSMFRDARHDRVEVFEQDVYDDHNDVEPKFSLMQSVRAMKKGVVESLPWRTICCIFCSLALAALVGIFLILFGDRLQGRS